MPAVSDVDDDAGPVASSAWRTLASIGSALVVAIIVVWLTGPGSTLPHAPAIGFALLLLVPLASLVTLFLVARRRA